AVSVLLAQASRALLGERVAVPLAVGGSDEGRDHVELPVADLVGLAPEIGETEVDVELQQVDAGGVLGHGKSLGPASDGIIARMSAVALALGSAIAWGCADFLGGLLSRRVAVWAVTVWSQ